MQDYIPQDPNRKKIIHADGSAEYVHIESADNPVANNPTPINKASLLDDDTCAILNIPATSTPNDALQKIVMSAGKYVFGITVQYADGAPADGITVSGLTGMNGGGAVTNEKGYVLGFSTTAGANLSISTPYLDINGWSGSVTSTAPITKSTVVLTKKTATSAQYTSSVSFRFSRLVSGFDATLVGGGGGGAGGIYISPSPYAGSGGGGGYVSRYTASSVAPTDSFSVSVGAGGRGGSYKNSGSDIGKQAAGGSGGSSQLTGNGSVLSTASGGNGGAYTGSVSTTTPGNGTGGAGTKNWDGEKGGDGTGGYGGGGGGGSSSTKTPTKGGSPYGGDGGCDDGNVHFCPTNGQEYGGGGGGAASTQFNPQCGAAGASGVVILTWRYKA